MMISSFAMDIHMVVFMLKSSILLIREDFLEELDPV